MSVIRIGDPFKGGLADLDPLDERLERYATALDRHAQAMQEHSAALAALGDPYEQRRVVVLLARRLRARLRRGGGAR
jgi:hypothetical protein